MNQLPRRQGSRFLVIVTICALAFFLLACGVSKRHAGSLGGASGTERKGPPLEAPTSTDFERLPFELWGYGQDADGQSLVDESIRRGDEYLKKGDYNSGLSVYRTVDDTRLSKTDAQSLAERISSAYLATSQFDDALKTVSSYCETHGVRSDGVTGQLALLLGYGYGALGDYDQSLAWMSRSATTETGSPIYADAAEKGARSLLASIPQSNFDLVFAKWKDDQNFGNLVIQEKAQRENPKNKNNYSFAAGGAFWRRSIANIIPPTAAAVAATTAQAAGVALDSVSVGVILPLTGPLAPLGEGTKNGMDLAIEVENEPKVKVIYKDATEVVATADTVAKELTETEKVNCIVGPLLTEQANIVRQTAMVQRVPMISLAKGNVFETGDMVFRFGATSNSQMDTLLDAASNTAGITRFGLVYPETPLGVEYANSFKKYISAKGLQLIYEATYAGSDKQKMQIVADEIDKLQIGGLFIPDSIDGAREFLSLLSESTRDRVRAMGPATWDAPQQIAQSQAMFNHAIFISPFFVGSTNPLVAKFIDRYKKKYGKAPDFLAAQGFDAMTMVIGAARQVMSSGQPFDLAMKGIEAYDGLTGTMHVDTSGEVSRAYSVLEVKDGRLQAIRGKENYEQKEPQK